MLPQILVIALLMMTAWVVWQLVSHQETKTRLSLLAEELRQAKGQAQAEQEKNLSLVKDKASLQAVNQELLHKLQENTEQTKKEEQRLLLQFNKLANDLLETKSAKFSAHNKTQMEGLLDPLKEKIKDFQQQIAYHQKSALESNLQLKQEFEKVHLLYEKIKDEAGLASRAILGHNKTQGSWGELHAMQLLESTGLKKNQQYFLQQGFSDTDGNRLIPDVLIKLPEERTIIMDVKVSLLHYAKYFHATDPKEQEGYLKQHVQSVRNHIKHLSEKNYAQAYALKSLDFVLMLLPMEPAFSLAIQHEPTLFQEAYEKNIVLVSPTSLRATLSIIDQVWKNTYQNQHAVEIAQKSGALYDKFAGFVADLQKLGAQLAVTQKTYEQAAGKLFQGKGNLVNRAEELRKLGARTSKLLPAAEERSFGSHDLHTLPPQDDNQGGEASSLVS